MEYLGRLALTIGAAALLAGCGGSQPPIGNGGVPSALVPAGSKTETFHYTGRKQTFIVPAHVKHVTVTVIGAGTPSAHGGLVAATIAVQPGESLAILVGGAPKGMKGGYNGGGIGGYCNVSDEPSCPLVGEGGAGASDVREGGNSVKDRVLVAGGAGGTGGKGQHRGGAGGGGGGLTGIHGHAGKGCFIASHNATVGGGGGGGGAKQTKGGGKAGTTNNTFIVVPGVRGANGTLAISGTGASNAEGDLFAGGAGGGGGGGYYGGGGGGSGASGCSPPPCYGRGAASGGGGGGGSSFAEASATGVTMLKGGGNAGNGKIIISW